MAEIRTRNRNQGLEKTDILQVLNNIFEYSNKNEELVILREVTPDYLKAVSNKNREYFFVLEPRRRGIFLQIIALLRRKESNCFIRWNQEGLPIHGVVLIDDMKDSAGNLWKQGFEKDQIQNFLTPSRPYKVG